MILRQQPLCGALQIDLTLAETFCIIRTALIASVAAAGANHIGKIDAVVISHPNDLRFMAFQHLQLLLDEIGHIHKFCGIKIDTGKGIHIVNGNHFGGTGYIRVIIGQGGGKAGIKNQAGNSRVVRHVIVRRVGDDEIGLYSLDDIHDLISGCFIVVIDGQIVVNEDLRELNQELHRQGNNLNQLVRLAHQRRISVVDLAELLKVYRQILLVIGGGNDGDR